MLSALVVAVTSFGIDPSHARRIRFSIPTAKATPADTNSNTIAGPKRGITLSPQSGRAVRAEKSRTLMWLLVVRSPKWPRV